MQARPESGVADEQAQPATLRAQPMDQGAALRGSSAMVRAVEALRRGRVGIALMELGLQRARLERLKRVAGPDGSTVKRTARIAFYGAARAVVRVPGSSGLAVLLERTMPTPWAWLKRRSDAYLTSARGAPLHLHDIYASIDSMRRLRLTRPTRVVHQFHSGSAVGDAVTNSMFLLQRWLQAQGYESEIFVRSRDPALADRLLTMDDLPRQGDYVLIVHHSMGYDEAECILGLPASKILIYHNITPAAFLVDAPWALPYEKQGRQLLDAMRPHMAAALACSEYNAIELRAHGYAAPQVCHFLFDVEQLLAQARNAPPREEDAPFTLLFVGRLVRSKGQVDLVDAFAAFHAAFERPCRLVLVGRADGSDSDYVAELHRRIALNGLQDDVLVTGAVSDIELHRWFSAADIYVSLSHHEGFGVPLVEAMAHDLPVVAWPAGGVPYTMGGSGVMLRERTPEAVARVLLDLATDPARRAVIASGQRAVLDGFRLEHIEPVMLNALATAGALPPPSARARAALAANLQVTVAGHVKGTYSLAAINRTLATVLEQERPGTVRLLPWENGAFADWAEVPEAERATIAALAARPAPVTSPAVVISQHYPPYVPNTPADAIFALLAWEESLLPGATVATLNAHFRAVLASSRFVAKSLVDSGVTIPVLPVGQAPSLEAFRRLGEERAEHQRATDTPVTFLHVSSCFPRKGVDVLIESFAASFRRTDPVRLVIKGFPNPHNDIEAQLAALSARDPDAPEIVFVNRDIQDEEELLALYRAADCVVLPTRGEGFNMPAAEALAAGIPLIVTGFSGHLDFCTADDARLVDFTFAQSRSHVASSGSLWVEPDPEDLARALREAFEDIFFGTGLWAARARRARVAVLDRLSQPAWARRVQEAILDTLLTPRTETPRLLWISSWDIPCGIAEYSRFLLDRIIAADPTARPTILCDTRTRLPKATQRLAVQCAWELGASDAAETLARAISADGAEAVVIQHQPGLLDWPHLVRLLHDRRLRGRTIVVTLHAVRPLLDMAALQRTETIAALARADRVLVHRIEDVNILKDAGLQANLTLFPHGVPAPRSGARARRLTSSDAPLIGCFGFFVPGKGIERLISAYAQLQKRWPRLRLRLLNAVHPFDNGLEVAKCRALAKRLGVEALIEWDTAFHPKRKVIERLAECDLIVMPYDESKESSSGAIRVALASGAPVAVTPVTIFDEVEAAVYRFERVDADAVAEGIDTLLRNQAARQRYQDAAAAWLADYGWDGLAQRLRGMLHGLHADRHMRAPDK